MARDDHYMHTITLSQGDLSLAMSALYVLGLRMGDSRYTTVADRMCVQVEQSMRQQVIAEVFGDSRGPA